jgi:hypothetical protein
MGFNGQYGFCADGYPQFTQPSDPSFMGIMSAASTKVEKQKDGEIIGFGTIVEPNSYRGWGMKAKYAENSTPENPIIYVETNYGGKVAAYNININEVDPRNASRLEIFALASYADDQGKGSGGTFGTYQTLRNFEDMAVHNGYFQSGATAPGIWKQFAEEKLNWESACNQLVNLFYKCNDLVQYKKATDILAFFKSL